MTNNQGACDQENNHQSDVNKEDESCHDTIITNKK